MVLTVHVPAWHLEEDCVVVAVGDHLSTWLEFREGTRGGMPHQAQHRLTGLARPAPGWDGAEWGRHPTIVDSDGAAIYWDAPRPVAGPVDVTGRLGEQRRRAGRVPDDGRCGDPGPHVAPGLPIR